jgi:uncharacterized protein YqeY
MSDRTEYGWNPEMTLSLLEKIKQDLKTAMLSKNQKARNAMRQIMAEFPKLTVPLTLESGKKSTRLKKPEEIIMKHFGKTADGKQVNQILQERQ